jgi:hypothetical protein
MGIGVSKEVVDEGDRVLLAGKPDYDRCDNMITTSRYTPWNFLFVVRTDRRPSTKGNDPRNFSSALEIFSSFYPPHEVIDQPTFTGSSFYLIVW